MQIVGLLLVGVLAGICAGMFGIGGGLIIVPALVFFYGLTQHAAVGTLIGPAVRYGEVADVVEDIVEAYLALRARPDELFIDTVKRLGVEPFKERVYATR